MVYRRGTVASLTGYETGILVFTTLVDATRGFKRHTELEQHKEELCVCRTKECRDHVFSRRRNEKLVAYAALLPFCFADSRRRKRR